MGTYALPTDTKHVSMESRQYSLGIDLGEGVPRIYLLVGAILGAFWITFVGVVIGANILTAIALYIGPPVIGTILACRKDRGDRYAYAAVLDRWRYLKRRHRPLIPTPGTRIPTGPVQRRLHQLIPAHRNRPRMVRAEFLVIDTATVKGIS